VDDDVPLENHPELVRVHDAYVAIPAIAQPTRLYGAIVRIGSP
jgi:hypothetical protein